MITKTNNTDETEFPTQEDTQCSTRVAPRIRLVGSSHAMRRVQREALLAARLNANVLITGERGVGKAAVARFIHEHSDRSRLGFATINCDGLPDLQFQSAMFGHVKGSFAGAYRDKPGLVESVTGGTIFLNEVGGLGPKMQARLLWFLESGEYLPLGSDRVRAETPARLGVRVIASTTANLPARVNAGLFLDDLYHRLTDVRFSVPPLRDRREDIPSLIDHFSRQFTLRHVPVRSDAPELSNAVRDALCLAEWPGNVRELESFVVRELLFAAGAPTGSLRPAHFELVNS